MYIPTIGVLKFVSLLPSFVKGKHIDNPKMSFVRHEKVSTVEYIGTEPFEIGIDGEIFTVDRAKIEVLKKAQKIVIPKNSSKK
jgi:diacylglycerol kinase family enzyme